MKRPDDVPAVFAMNFFNVVPRIESRVEPGSYTISALSPRISEAIPVHGVDVTLWGVPADPSHDLERGTPGPSSAPRLPLLTSPTSCGGVPKGFTLEADSWWSPGAFVGGLLSADAEGTPFTFSGCERLAFEPAASIEPSSHAAGTPTGLEATIAVPQNESPEGLATAHVRKTVVTLPKGFTINPAAAPGQSGCSEAEIGIGSNDPPTCPASSKLGSVKIQTPLLEDEMEGSVYLARQNENPFGSLLALYMAVKGPGFYLKLPGKVELDQATGQVVTSFSETPQLPFEDLTLSLRSGSGAPLVTPSACGTYEAKIAMTSWASSVPIEMESPIAIAEGCSGGSFAPKLRAGTASPSGGSYSPFTLQVTRNDGEQNLARIGATLPEGLLAKLAGVPLCGDAQAASGDCPSGSQVGTTTVAAGAGSSPLYVPEAGKPPTAVYLAGPYKGAPYSLVVKVPAQAGPFDLGNVVVRNALDVDPVSTQVTASSDPLPQILQGIPISYRDLRVEIDRPEFTLNPTSCEAKKVEGSIAGANGASADPSAPFQAVNCERLGFKPTLALKLKGATHRSANPKLTATLTMPRGGANIARAAVTLPRTEFLDQSHIKTICTRVQYAAGAGGGAQCPKASVYGFAKAWSPLLDEPVEGPVFLRSSSHPLPDLVASLNGPVHIDLQGRIDSVSARIRNTFDFVPDVPVSKFVLSMQGGKKGLLVNNTELCKTKPVAEARFTGQNGKASDSSPVAQVGCAKGRKAKK